METLSPPHPMATGQHPIEPGTSPLALREYLHALPRGEAASLDIQAQTSTDIRHDVGLERLIRPEEMAPGLEVARRNPEAVVQGAGAAALDGYIGRRRAPETADEGTLRVRTVRQVRRYGYDARHTGNAPVTTKDDGYRFTRHRAPDGPMDKALRFAGEQLREPKRRRVVLAAVTAGTIVMGMNATGHDKPAPAQADAPAVAEMFDRPAPTEPQTKVVYEKVAEISPRQKSEISSLPGLSQEQKGHLTEFADNVIKLKFTGELKEVNTDVMTAQWSQETGNGTSVLGKEYHNYFGIKAGKDWKGPKVKRPTFEEVKGKLVRIQADFRVYKTVKDGILGYRDKLRNSPWFTDALGTPDDASKTLDNLLDDGMAWATDSSYKNSVLARGKAIHASSITKVEKVNVIKRVIGLPPKQETPAAQPDKEPYYKLGFKQEHTSSERQQILEVNTSDKAWITLPNGKKKLDRKIGRAERIKIIETNLNNAHATPEGYANFLKNDFIDITDKVPKKMSNYDGRRNGMGTVKPKGTIKYLVHHYTATNSNVDTYDGMKFAGTMQNSGPLAVQFNTNKSDVYALTKSRTSHVRGFNSVSFGNETHAPSQVGVSAKQYENNIYLDLKFLTENGYITKDKPVGKTIDSMMKGHHELNPYGHNDYPTPVMNVIRAKLKNLAKKMGYKI